MTKPNISFGLSGEWHDTDIVGVLRGMYIHQVRTFMKHHPCKDCKAYLHHQESLAALDQVDQLKGFDNSSQ